MCMAGCSAGTTCATPRRRGDCRAPRLWSRRCGRNTRSKSCWWRSEEHTSELQSRLHLVCRLLLEKKKKMHKTNSDPCYCVSRVRCLSSIQVILASSDLPASLPLVSLTHCFVFRLTVACDLVRSPS